jgi:hypothetical protein
MVNPTKEAAVGAGAETFSPSRPSPATSIPRASTAQRRTLASRACPRMEAAGYAVAAIYESLINL